MRQAIIYVTRDKERALGLKESPEYKIITNKEGETLDTLELLKNAEKTIRSAYASSAKNKPGILVFKNTPQIESFCKENKWQLLNPSAALSEKIENKVTQVKWLGNLAEKYLVPNKIDVTKNIKWTKKPLVIQWAHGHTGEGTLIINSADELADIQKKFPEREARVSDFVNGPSFTMNLVISKNKVYKGNLSYQITGLPPFTDNAFSTVGNDWSLPHTLLSEKEIAYIEEIANEIGTKLQKDGWIGMCGIDVIKDMERDQIYLIEINARQPASTTYESQLQSKFRGKGLKGLTIFEAYIGVLREEKMGEKNILNNEPIIEINDGAQIIQRITKNINRVDPQTIEKLNLLGYKTIVYNNADANADLIRIQCALGLIEAHGKLNERGKEIATIIEK